MTAKIPSRKTGLRQKAQLMSASEIERTLVRLAYEIVEKNSGVNGLGLVGIRRRGVPIAERLGRIITRIENAKVPVGTLDITFYRDDLSTLGPKPVVQEKEIGFEIEDKNIVLVDDVLYGTHDAGCLGCAFLSRQATACATLRFDRPWPSRDSRRGDLRRPQCSDHSK
jgi:pyrimidine operon attenuation protein / uracil phosphoribosyltransferase